MQDPMTIGEIILCLERFPPETPVCFDFCGCVPTTVGSWRGDYALPALGWSAAGHTGEGKPPTARALIEELARASNGQEVFPGWKGGNYRFRRDHVLAVDNPGDCTDTSIISIEYLEYEAVLCTRMTKE